MAMVKDEREKIMARMGYKMENKKITNKIIKSNQVR